MIKKNNQNTLGDDEAYKFMFKFSLVSPAIRHFSVIVNHQSLYVHTYKKKIKFDSSYISLTTPMIRKKKASNKVSLHTLQPKTLFKYV